MEIKLETERLKIRSITKKDLKFILEIELRPETNEYESMDTPDEDYLTERFNWFLENAENLPNGGGVRFIVQKGTKKIGDMSLVCTWEDTQEWELGFSFLSEYWGNGYASESVRAIAQLAFEELGIHKLVMNINADNVRSTKLAEKLGFVKESHLREARLYNGKWNDETMYAMLRCDYNKMIKNVKP